MSYWCRPGRSRSRVYHLFTKSEETACGLYFLTHSHDRIARPDEIEFQCPKCEAVENGEAEPVSVDYTAAEWEAA